MQQLTADYSTALLRWSGVPVFHENWIIVIPGGTFLVAEACAGVRFLIASLALGALISGTMFQSWAKRSFYMLLSVLVPILANVVRAYGIVMIAHLSNFELAVGVDHLVYGFVFLSFVMLLLFGIAWMMRDPLPQGPAQPLPREEGAAQSASMGYILGVFTAALFISLGLRLYAFDMMRGNAISPVTLHAPAASGDWRLLGRAGPGQWQGSFVGADGQATWLYSNGDHRVSLFVAYYGDEAPGKELIAGRNNLTGSKDLEAIKSGITKEDVFGYGLVPSSYLIVPEDTGARRYVWYWYVLSDDVTARQADVKVASLAAKLSGGRAEGMIVAVSMLVETPEDIAIVGDFLNAAGLHESLNAGGFAPFVTTDIQ
ncbi:hypothetical protein JCM17844_00790 [Iodidimonas gelatinilytica]|uniref:Methanolan biosynthesis EpsI domain-containing protein n=1 Tax=Iodidimonas gelatinilytica TaxID=1236966 RepID=A0A5A7MK99_9PROT|nr:hypothetical protein JCM17844_00790 [Iodidimonas gelatinilytica]